MSIEVVLAMIVLTLLPAAALAGDDASARVERALCELDATFDSSFDWWTQVYDPASGGCYYSLSGKEAARGGDDRFGPDIEATSKLVRVMAWTGLIEDSSPAFRDGVIAYMQERQDPDSGFFRDSQHIEQYSHNSLERATGMALTTLELCGGEPLYPPPLERVEDNAQAAEHYAHLRSPEAMRTWLEDLPWERRTWTAGARIRSQASALEMMPTRQRTELVDVVEQVVIARQRDDGFFGSRDDHWTSQLSGTYKIAAFFDRMDRDVPRAEAMARTVLEHLRHRDYRNSIVLYNTANVLHLLHRRGANLNLQTRLDIVERATDLLQKMRGDDGGFVTHLDKPDAWPNGRQSGLEVVESNTNATGLAHKTRMLLIELLTDRPAPHPHPGGAALLELDPQE